MNTLPHDVADLNLAPVVLAVDTRIEELGKLSTADLAYQIALEGDHPDRTLELREAGLLQAIGHFVATHDWELSIDSRGVRLSHQRHTLVLGLPDTIKAYLYGS